MKRDVKNILPMAVVLSCMVLASCRSAETRIFTLTDVAAGTRLDWQGPPLRVDAVHVPPGLDRLEIVSGVAPGELKIHDLAHWAAPLSQVARQALSLDLAARLPPDKVASPHLPKPDGALAVSVDILDFKLDAAGAQLRASWAFSRNATTAQQHTVLLQASATGHDAAGIALGLSALLAQLADRIAASLSDAPP